MLRKSLVVYDGACGICGGNLKWLYRLDWFRRFDALPYQSDEVYKASPQLTREACEQALQLVLKNGRIHSGTDAFREVFLRMPLTFPVGLLITLISAAILKKRKPDSLAEKETSGSA